MKNYLFFAIIICLLFTSCVLIKPEAVSDGLSRKDYQPFKEGTKAVMLPEVATLKLENNLPIIDGATALYPLYAAFVQAVYPQGEYSIWDTSFLDDDGKYVWITPIVRCTTTGGAYMSLISGEVDIIFCAGPSDQQIEMAKYKGVEFNLTPIGKEAFVFFVNNRNPVSNLTTEQIKGIYSGKITKWREVGGKNKNIKAYQRSKNSGSQTMLESIIGDDVIMEPITEIALGMMDIINVTANYRNYNNAIGYSFLFYTTQMVRNNKIKLLSINGVLPSPGSIQAETYPYTDYFYAITTNTKNENVGKFIEWILSDQGQFLVKETGYVPLR